MILNPDRKKRAFTLIELLIVIAIIGILAAIAIPMFLGQKEKAKVRVVEISAKSAANELQSVISAYLNGEPIVILSATQTETCVEAAIAKSTRSCNVYFPTIASVAQYTDLDSIINYYLTNRRSRGERSPYNPTLDLFTLNDPAAGQISLTNASDRDITIRGYGEFATSLIFNATVLAK